MTLFRLVKVRLSHEEWSQIMNSLLLSPFMILTLTQMKQVNSVRIRWIYRRLAYNKVDWVFLTKFFWSWAFKVSGCVDVRVLCIGYLIMYRILTGVYSCTDIYIPRLLKLKDCGRTSLHWKNHACKHLNSKVSGHQSEPCLLHGMRVFLMPWRSYQRN